MLRGYGAVAWQARYSSVQEGPEALRGVGLGSEALLQAAQMLVTPATMKWAVVVTMMTFVSLPVTLRRSQGSADWRPDLALQSARKLLYQLQEPVRGWTAKVAVVKTHGKHLSSAVFQHCLCCHTVLVRCVHFCHVVGEGLADLKENLSALCRCHVALRCPFEGVVVLAVERVEQAASAVPQVRVYQSMLERCRRSPEF